VGVSGCTADRTTPQSTVAELTIDSVPLLEIGTRDGPGETQFAEVYGVTRLRGDGPGEYRKPGWIAESDSGGLFVHDAFAEAVGRLIRCDPFHTESPAAR